MKALRELFSDHTGQLSSIRLYSFIALIVAIFLTFRADTSFEIFIILIAAAFVPKVLQKLIEKIADKKIQ